MAYVTELDSIKHQADVIFNLHGAVVRSTGRLKITLLDGTVITGRYFGVQCSANDGCAGAYKVKCSVSIGDEDDEYSRFIDALDIKRVEAQ